MDFAIQRRVLYLVTTIAILGSCAMIYWATAGLPDYQPNTMIVTSDERASSEEGSTDQRKPSIVKRELRGPLYDPPPKPVVPKPVVPKQTPKPPPKPKLNWTLVGTLIESGSSVAIVADETGEFDVKGEGDSLELEPQGVQIKSITAEQVTLAFRGAETTLSLDKKPRKGGSPKRNQNRRRP